MNDVNREVAEKVMGWTEECPTDPRRLYWKGSQGPLETHPAAAMIGRYFDPLHKIEHAWMVVEKFDGCLHLRQHNKNGKWEAFFCDAGPGHEAEGDTAQEAICKAALAAKEGEHE